VVCDRYLDSSVAFQGGGRGLGLDRIRNVSLFATDGLLPDRTIVLAGAARAPQVADRIEVEGDRFRAAVTAAFAEIARREPGRVRLVDGDGDVVTVAERVWEAVGA
jgi:dTMP kinase